MDGLEAILAVGAIMIVFLLIVLIVAYVISSLAYANLNKKAGKSAGLGWIPVYNVFYAYQNAGMLWLAITHISLFALSMILSCAGAPEIISKIMNVLSLAVGCYGAFWLAKAYNAPQGLQIVCAIPYVSGIGLLIVAFSKDTTFNGPVCDFIGGKIGFNKTSSTGSNADSVYTNYDNGNQGFDNTNQFTQQQNQFNQAQQFGQQQFDNANQFAQQQNQFANQQFMQQQFDNSNQFAQQQNQFANQQFNNQNQFNNFQ